MKEFGIYNVKPTYLAKFVGVENQLAALKLTVRPFVCVKIKDSDGQLRNWLIPLSSINPLAKDYSYSDRMSKYNYYNVCDKYHYPCAIDVFNDLLDNRVAGYKDVALYYNAIPIKGEYCKPYKAKNGQQKMVDRTIGTKMRQRLKDYLSARAKGQQNIGFIKEFVDRGDLRFSHYPIDQLALRRALYKNHIQLLQQRKQKLKEHEQFEQEQQRRRKLKRRYKGLTDDELVAATLDQCDEKLSQELAQQKTQRKKQSENQQIGQAQQAEQVKPLQNRQKGAQKQKSKPDGSGKK